MENISLASYSFNNLLSRGLIDVFGYLESVKYHYNLMYADIWNGFLTSYDDEYLAKIREAMDDKGIELASLCCDWAHPYDNDADVMAKNNATAQNCLKAAEILGAKTVRFDVGIRDEVPTEAQYDIVVKAFSAYAQRGYDHGYMVGPENHWGASRHIDVQKELFKRVNHSGYGTLLHFGNWAAKSAEEADAWDIEAAPMAVHTHIQYEYADRAAERLPLMRAAGYKGKWSVEHHSGAQEYKKVEIQLGKVRLANC